MIDISQYVEEVHGWFKKAPEIEKQTFINTKRSSLVRYHHSLGMNIRNHFKLWTHPWTEEIVDNVDCSPDHPDAVSMRIIEAVYDKIKAEEGK